MTTTLEFALKAVENIPDPGIWQAQEIAEQAFKRVCAGDNNAQIVLNVALEYLETKMPKQEFLRFCSQF